MTRVLRKLSRGCWTDRPMVRRATYSFAYPSPFEWFGDGHVVVAGEGVTVGDGFAAFS